MFFLYTLLAIFLLQVAKAQATGANLVENGDFETLSAGKYAPWRCLFDDQVSLPKGNSSCCGVDTAGQFTFPATGEKNMFLFHNCAMDQNITLAINNVYRVKFFAYCVDCDDSTGTNLELKAGGVKMVSTVLSGTAQAGPYAQYMHSFKAKNANPLRFTYRGPGALRIDAVEVRKLDGNPDGGVEDGSVGAVVTPSTHAATTGVDNGTNNLVSNGDFEGADLTPWTCSSISPATGEATAVQCCGIDRPSGDTFAAAGSGNAFAFQNCFLNQSVTIKPGENYTLSYQAFVANGDNSAGNLKVSLGGVQIPVNVPAGAPASGPYTAFSHVITAVDASPLQFLMASQVGALRFDSVSLTVGATEVAQQSSASNIIVPDGVNVVSNGGFEDSTDVTPWKCSVSGCCGVDTKTPDTFPNSGQRNAFLRPNCTISQATNFTTGQKYVLSYEAYCLDCDPTKKNLKVRVGGITLQDKPKNGTSTGGPYNQFVHEITPKSGDIISFEYIGTGAFRIDDIQLILAPGPTADVGTPNTSTNGTTSVNSGTVVDDRLGTDMVTNGDFEGGPTLDPWSCTDVASGDVSTGCGVDFKDGSTTFSDSGQRNAFVISGAEIVQTINITTAGSYFMSFAAYCVDCDEKQGATVGVSIGTDASFKQFVPTGFVNSGPYGKFSRSINITTLGPMDIRFAMTDSGFLRLDTIKLTLLSITDADQLTSDSQLLANGNFESSTGLTPWLCLRNAENSNECCGTDTIGDQTFPIGTRNAFVFQGCAIQQSVNVEPGMYLLTFSAYCFDCQATKGNLVVELGGAKFEDQVTPGTIQAGPYSSYTHFVNVTTQAPLKVSWTKPGGVRLDSFNLVSQDNPTSTQFSSPSTTGSLTANAHLLMPSLFNDVVVGSVISILFTLLFM